MPAKIRLQRHGKKGRPYFHIVVADGRAPRDGRFIERIGAYNPITDPATIELDTEKATDWLMKGAQPTETAKAILSYKGVLYRVHLNKGVAKGSLTQDLADSKFAAWLEEKTNKIDTKKSRLANESQKEKSTRLAAETKANEARAEMLKKKEAEAKFQTEKAAETEAAEEAAPEAPAPGEETTEA